MIIPARENAIITRFRAECAKLPNVTETITWGHPIFRVGDAKGKMFAGVGDYKDVWGIGLNVGKETQREMLKRDPKRFFPTPYAAHLGWVSMRLDGRMPWKLLLGLTRLAHANVHARVIGAPASAAGRTRAARKKKPAR